MRKAMILATGLLLAGALAGCGKGGADDPSVPTAQGGGANPSASASFDPATLAKCMHDHGMDWFPEISGTDPDPDIEVPDGVDREKLNAAVAVCKQYAPPGMADQAGQQVPAGDREKALAYSKCMRENGLPDFPDPTFENGGMSLRLGKKGIDPKSDTFKAADQKCKSLLPVADDEKGD
jgi:hypothetical protein